MKLPLILTCCFGLMGCKDPRSLSTAEIERILVESAHFETVELQQVSENEYRGLGTEPNGLTYDLKIPLTADYVNWQAATKPVPISKLRIEDTGSEVGACARSSSGRKITKGLERQGHDECPKSGTPSAGRRRSDPNRKEAIE